MSSDLRFPPVMLTVSDKNSIDTRLDLLRLTLQHRRGRSVKIRVPKDHLPAWHRRHITATNISVNYLCYQNLVLKHWKNNSNTA